MNITDAVFLEEFRRNWKILAIAFVCFLFAFSAPAFSLPFLYRSVIEEFGWTREQATLLASAKYATGAIFSILIGRFIDVIGIRNVLITVSALGAFAMVSFLWTPNLTIYYLSGVLLGIASPGTIVAVKVLISRTFHASQGTAMGIAMLGTALGAVIVPLAITYLIGNYGWRGHIQGEPASILDSKIGPDDINLFTEPGGEHRNFLDCIKTRSEPYFPVEIGHRCCSVNLCVRTVTSR